MGSDVTSLFAFKQNICQYFSMIHKGYSNLGMNITFISSSKAKNVSFMSREAKIKYTFFLPHKMK